MPTVVKLTECEHIDYVGVPDPVHGPSLFYKPTHEIGDGRRNSGEHFDSHVLSDYRMLPRVHRGHAPLTQLSTHYVSGHHRARN
jgi:hypothetical protein